jgi:hypothetical protein
MGTGRSGEILKKRAGKLPAILSAIDEPCRFPGQHRLNLALSKLVKLALGD